MHVAVVGGGVIGLTTALAVKDAFPGCRLTVISEKFSPDTTGDGSAGLWGPYLLGNTPVDSITRWAKATHLWLEKLWTKGLAAETGISLFPVYRMNIQTDCEPDWIKIPYGARRLQSEELKMLSEEHGIRYINGWHFVTFTSEPTRLLPWLTKELVARGVVCEKRKVAALSDLVDEDYDLIINCTGLGARQLVNDEQMTAIRGQVSRVKAPWATYGFLLDDDDCYYIIPNINDVVLGGTHQLDDYDCFVRKKDTEYILNGCCKIMPSLTNAEMVKSWVGLRPGRPQVRLEEELLPTMNGRKVFVIHNYGHGGAGITLSWGCALDVVEIMKNTLRHEHKSKL